VSRCVGESRAANRGSARPWRRAAPLAVGRPQPGSAYRPETARDPRSRSPGSSSSVGRCAEADGVGEALSAAVPSCATPGGSTACRRFEDPLLLGAEGREELQRGIRTRARSRWRLMRQRRRPQPAAGTRRTSRHADHAAAVGGVAHISRRAGIGNEANRRSSACAPASSRSTLARAASSRPAGRRKPMDRAAPHRPASADAAMSRDSTSSRARARTARRATPAAGTGKRIADQQRPALPGVAHEARDRHRAEPLQDRDVSTRRL